MNFEARRRDLPYRFELVISARCKDDQGTTRTLDFAYDAIGQLIEVRNDGVVTGSYSYDANGNRLSSLTISNAERHAFWRRRAVELW